MVRSRGRCMVYAPLLDKVETDLDFALRYSVYSLYWYKRTNTDAEGAARPYPRVVGDMEFDTSLPGAAGFFFLCLAFWHCIFCFNTSLPGAAGTPTARHTGDLLVPKYKY